MRKTNTIIQYKQNHRKNKFIRKEEEKRLTSHPNISLSIFSHLATIHIKTKMEIYRLRKITQK